MSEAGAFAGPRGPLGIIDGNYAFDVPTKPKIESERQAGAQKC
jgi:hypothetical protein